ncbi:MAG: nitroreductase family protein [Elusimicrobiota bacterium]
MTVTDFIKTRRSVRKFLNKPVPKEILEDIIDCGRLAPSANNVQPWEFIVITDAVVKKKVSDATDHGRFIEDAPVCIAVFCMDTKYYLEDGCAAVENILIAAASLGLGACWVAGDKKPYGVEIKKILSVPEKYKLISLIPVGYTDEKPRLRKRKLAEVIHWEKY